MAAEVWLSTQPGQRLGLGLGLWQGLTSFSVGLVGWPSRLVSVHLLLQVLQVRIRQLGTKVRAGLRVGFRVGLRPEIRAGDTFIVKYGFSLTLALA